MSELPPEAIILWQHLALETRKSVSAQHRRGELIKLHRGAYVDSALWSTLDSGAQHRARALAVATHFGSELVFSHLTAAAFWRLPRVGDWPSRPHVAGPVGPGGTSTAAFVRHGLGIPTETVAIQSLAVSPLATTVVEVAASVGLAHAVVIADAALRRAEHPLEGVPATSICRADVLTQLEHAPWSRGAVKARRAIDFADGRADGPGESMSRVSMHVASVSPPELQVSMLGASGKEYTVDFWWRKYNTIGEFDGKYKYTDPEYMGGRSAEQVLYDEKLREDDLRAAKHGFTRWPWATAVSPALMRAHLARAGVR